MAMVIGCNKATLTRYDGRRVGCPTLCGGGVSTPYGSKTVYSANVPTHLVKPKLRYMGVSNTRMQASPAPLSREEQQPPRDGLNVVGKPKVVSGLTTNAPPPPPISKSDAVFLEELGVEFVWGTSDLSVDELNDLFEKVGFPRRDPGRLATALVNTHRSIWVRAARKSRLAKQGQLLGFGRATSDGALSATIWDVAVAPAWQRGGLGRGLVERLTASLVDEGIPIVTLYAEPGVVGLYEKLGFVKDPLAVKGLAFQTKSERGQKLLASIQ